MAKLTRRDFIKISGGALPGVAGSGLLLGSRGLRANSITDPGTAADRVMPSFCGLCLWNCGILVHVKDEKIIKITGNPDHPLSSCFAKNHRGVLKDARSFA